MGSQSEVTGVSDQTHALKGLFRSCEFQPELGQRDMASRPTKPDR